MHEEFLKQFEAVINNNPTNTSMLANASAILNEYLKDINWVGFYLYTNGELALGPFQGKIACTRIPIGKGVCGTSFDKKELLNVRDVHEFPGHIACDQNTNSEIVIPLIAEGKRFGVLDIDSISYDRFDLKDEILLQACADKIALKLLNKK